MHLKCQFVSFYKIRANTIVLVLTWFNILIDWLPTSRDVVQNCRERMKKRISPPGQIRSKVGHKALFSFVAVDIFQNLSFIARFASSKSHGKKRVGKENCAGPILQSEYERRKHVKLKGDRKCLLKEPWTQVAASRNLNRWIRPSYIPPLRIFIPWIFSLNPHTLLTTFL